MRTLERDEPGPVLVEGRRRPDQVQDCLVCGRPLPVGSYMFTTLHGELFGVDSNCVKNLCMGAASALGRVSHRYEWSRKPNEP